MRQGWRDETLPRRNGRDASIPSPPAGGGGTPRGKHQSQFQACNNTLPLPLREGQPSLAMAGRGRASYASLAKGESEGQGQKAFPASLTDITICRRTSATRWERWVSGWETSQ